MTAVVTMTAAYSPRRSHKTTVPASGLALEARSTTWAVWLMIKRIKKNRMKPPARRVILRNV
jgi:hypothetical protein